MSNFEQIFDDFFTLGFGRPKRLVFNSQVKDQMPSYWTKQNDNTYLCTVKTLGIEPDAIIVKEADEFYGLIVSGESEVNSYKYNTNIELPISETIMNEIQNISFTSKNGLTFITLTLNKPEKNKIKIERN